MGRQFGALLVMKKTLERLALHIPSMRELGYRQQLLEDPETMSYNRGYASFEGYDSETGCIAFPQEMWQAWYEYFIGREPERFYAYIVRLEDRVFLGEVNVHKARDQEWYEMGIVLEAKHRGKGYAQEALRLLLKYAFEKMDVPAVHNSFEEERIAALRTHLAVGFRECKKEDGCLQLLITKEQWFKAAMLSEDALSDS